MPYVLYQIVQFYCSLFLVPFFFQCSLKLEAKTKCHITVYLVSLNMGFTY